MRKALMVLGAVALLTGCKPVQGERFWWDDQKKEQLPNTYMLPEWPAASPVPTEPVPFVPKQLPDDEIKRAQAEQQKKIDAGISRVGVPDPNTNRVKVPVAKWEGGESVDEKIIDVRKKGDETDVSQTEVKEKDGNFSVKSEEKKIESKPEGAKPTPANDTGAGSVPARAKASATSE